jgi:hypothetical protein
LGQSGEPAAFKTAELLHHYLRVPLGNCLAM